MNKKGLSVLLASAIFSSRLTLIGASGDIIEISAANKGKLINQLSTKLWNAPRFSNDYKVDSRLRGKSIYGIQINDDVVNQSITDFTDKNTSSKGMLEKSIKNYLD